MQVAEVSGGAVHGTTEGGGLELSLGSASTKVVNADKCCKDSTGGRREC